MGANKKTTVRLKSARGFTLIELVVSFAVMSIIMAAVVSVVVTISRQRRETTASVDTRTNGRTALALMKFDAVNAGYRFGAAPFAVRVLQNVTGAEAELADTVDCGMGGSGWTVMPGTDVIEFREARPTPNPGKSASGATGCAGASCSHNLNDGAFPNPFSLTDPIVDGIVIFSGTKIACAARMVSPTTITMLKQDLRTDAAASNYPMAMPGACPQPGMTVTALGPVARYFVCRPPAGNPLLRPALFRQSYTGKHVAGGLEFNGPNQGITRVQDAVEDLQIATLLQDPAGLVSGPTCSGAGVAHQCWCGVTIGGDCAQFVPDPTIAGTLNGLGAPAEATAFLPRAFRVSLTTISDRERGFSDQATLRRPAVFDHDTGPTTWGAAVATDGNQRAVYEELLIPQNLTLVEP